MEDTVKALRSTIAEKDAQILALKASQTTQNETITELFTLLEKRDALLEKYRQAENQGKDDKARPYGSERHTLSSKRSRSLR